MLEQILHRWGFEQGMNAARWLMSWRVRIGIALFCISVYNWGIWGMLIVMGGYAVVLKKYFSTPAVDEEPTDTSHGSARWARNSDMEPWLSPTLNTGRYVLGISPSPIEIEKDSRCMLPITSEKRFSRLQTCLPVITTGDKSDLYGRADEGHLITVAGTGAGKGIAVVTPNLMTYEGPIVVFDPKGESYKNTAGQRERHDNRVCLLDPFGALAQEECSKKHLSRLNPLSGLLKSLEKGDHGEVLDEATALAEMVCPVAPNEKEPHWTEKARSFLKAAILFLVYDKSCQDRTIYPVNFESVKRVILDNFRSEMHVTEFVERCRNNDHLSFAAGEIGMVAREERQSILSNLNRHLEFLNSPNVRESLAESTFDVTALKQQRITIYLVLPANRMNAYSRVARLWIGSILQELMRDTVRPHYRVLFLLDEVAQLGQMEILTQAISLARGYGIDLWMLFQDINQMKATYGDKWQTFLANAKVKQFFGVRDLETAEYVSKLLGQATIQTTSVSNSTSTGSNFGASSSDGGGSSSWGSSSSESVSVSVQSTGRALLQPDEVMRLDDMELLLLVSFCREIDK